MTQLKVKKVHPNAVIPVYQTAGASGLDLHACLPEGHGTWVVLAGGRLLIPTGLAIEVPEGHEAQIRPRSGLAHKHGVYTCFGTIDSDYRGEISINLFNNSFSTYHVKHGERVAQMVICPVVQVTIEEVAELSVTVRGDKGFGSSGKL